MLGFLPIKRSVHCSHSQAVGVDAFVGVVAAKALGLLGQLVGIADGAAGGPSKELRQELRKGTCKD